MSKNQRRATWAACLVAAMLAICTWVIWNGTGKSGFHHEEVTGPEEAVPSVASTDDGNGDLENEVSGRHAEPILEPIDFNGSFVGGQIVFQQSNLALSVPGDWVAAVTKQAKRKLRRPSNQSDYVYDAMYDAILPKTFLLFHVGGEEFGGGSSFADVHLRVKT